MKTTPHKRAASCLLVVPLLVSQASAQSFQFANSQLPQGSPFNNSATENVDFADVDLDGDMDCANADGGDGGNDQNRLWMNMGFAQGGTIGFFEDQTATRFPAVLDDSRDMDFVDFDNDGDEDLYISNTSQISPNTNRLWVNQGLAQSGAPGFFQDETSTRWLELGLNNASDRCSSIPPNFVFSAGGFQDWSCDCVFGDLDDDGDVDLLHSTYGGAFGGNTPQRVFMNDGQGRFKEYNPSCYQLANSAIPDGAPALWAQGNQLDGGTDSSGASADIDNTPLGVEIGDIDGDFDIDFLIGSRSNPPPRLFRNMKAEAGLLIWRDVTFGQLAEPVLDGSNYEQEFGDMEPDGDLDIYGLNWPGLSDAVYANDGTGNYGPGLVLASSGADDNEGDWFDYNNDGRMDIFVGNFSGQDRLYQGDGNGNFANVTAAQLPGEGNTTLGVDSCDIELDGDYDLIDANDGSQANTLFKNVSQVPDTFAALINAVEQASDRLVSPAPTAIRAALSDNASWDVLRYNQTVLQYQVNGGAFSDVPMIFAGGQLFRGSIPGELAGTIGYRVRTTDEHGNTSVSGVLSYVGSSGVCNASIASYCTAQTSSSGCVPAMTATGLPNLSHPDAFAVRATSLESGQNGLVFFGTSGPSSTPFGGGVLCVNPPLFRLGIKNSLGAAPCSGQFIYSLDEMLAQPQGGPLLVANQAVHAQAWFRDPPAVTSTGLTGGVTFLICP